MTTAEGEALAKKLKAAFIESSAKDNKNVGECHLPALLCRINMLGGKTDIDRQGFRGPSWRDAAGVQSRTGKEEVGMVLVGSIKFMPFPSPIVRYLPPYPVYRLQVTNSFGHIYNTESPVPVFPLTVTSIVAELLSTQRTYHITGIVPTIPTIPFVDCAEQILSIHIIVGSRLLASISSTRTRCMAQHIIRHFPLHSPSSLL